MRVAEALAQRSSEQEIILAHILKCQTIDLYKNPQRIITPAQYARFQKLLRKYKKGWPVAYLTGYKEFMSLDFKVTPAVLIPRPETELLVEQAIKCIDVLTQDAGRKTLYAIDIGTGSGNIAISIAKHSPVKNLRIVASDISRPALRIARFNARQHQVGKYVRFCYGNLFGPFKGIKADVIVSNPPYVDRAEKSKWQSGLKYEPQSALWSGQRGLSYIERIIKQAPDYLKTGGYLLMEIGIGQAKEALRIIKSTGSFRDIKIINDYNRIPRILFANRR